MSAYNRPAYYGANSQDGLGFYERIGLGLEKENGYFAVAILGNRPAVNSGDIIKNWAAGGLYLYPDDAGEAMEVSAPAGIVTDVKIWGLGPDLVLQDPVIVTTDGANPVPIPGLWSRITGMRNVGAVVTDGEISTSAAGPSVEPFCAISANSQRAGTGMYTVPAGWSGQVLSVIGSMEKTKGTTQGATFKLFQKQQGGVEVADFAFGVQTDGTTSTTFRDLLPFGVPEKTDIVARADVTSDGDVSLLIRITMLLSKNSVTGVE